MKDATKETVKSGAYATAEVVASAYDNMHFGGAPVAMAVVQATEVVLDGVMRRRQDKTSEWFGMFQGELPAIKREVLESDEFQDTFISSFEVYLKERNTEKRVLLRNIFRDYSSVRNPEEYPIERYYEIVRQITLYEAKLLSRYIKEQQEQPARSLSTSPTNLESTLHLISLGLLIQEPAGMISDGTSPIPPVRVWVSSVGRKFSDFILD